MFVISINVVTAFPQYRVRWGTKVTRGKAVFCFSRKTRMAKKLLIDQQLQLTTNQIGAKN